VLKAAGIDPRPNLTVYESRYETGLQVGYPDNVNATYGLMDASGSALQAVLREYEPESTSERLGFDEVYAAAQETTGMMSGAAWYHWVSLRGISGDALWIGNSAPGYKGIHDILSRADFERLGPFNVVLLT
jgi:hypothetical protein